MSATTRTAPATAPPHTATTAPPRLGTWVLGCALAESVGLAASATAGRLSQTAVTGPQGLPVLGALGLVLAGGLVEGTALGVLQSTLLASWLRGRRAWWVLATVLVAGVGWAAGSAPALLAAGGTERAGGAGPSRGLVLLGAAGLGLGMGALLGGAQALVLRGRVRHPVRWVGANAVGWALAMPVVFAGAGVPAASWSLPTVALAGASTGLAAGAVLGLVSGAVLPSLDRTSVSGRLVLALLASPVHRLLGGSLVGLALTGTVSGRPVRLPVMYARDRVGLVVLPGGFERKRWWRNLRRPQALAVLLGGRWRPAVGALVPPTDPGYPAAVATYRRRWPQVQIDPGAPVVRLVLRAVPSSATTGTPGRRPMSPGAAGGSEVQPTRAAPHRLARSASPALSGP